MATRTQFQLEPTSACIHERLCQAMYLQQYRRIHALCQWMTDTAAAARDLAQAVFIDACAQAGPGWPAVSGDALAASLVLRFRHQIHAAADAPPAVAGDGAPHQRARAAAPVRDAVSALPPTHRLLYLLHELEGYSAATLGDWLNLEPERCALLIHSARLQLRRELSAA
jgi:DNA-directed RNA polymerase specialized sigma24 family protein